MAVWLVRAGAHGEYELKFIQENKIYVTWDNLDVNLSALKERTDLLKEMTQRYPNDKYKTILNWVSQVWPFAHEMHKGDLVILPLKSQPSIQVGEIDGEYHFEPKGPDPYFHWRPVKWIGEAIPRSNFGQDLLYTFGAFLTICRVKRNNAEERIKTMRDNGWKPESIKEIMGFVGVAPTLLTNWSRRGNIGTVLPGHEEPPIGNWRFSGAKLKEIGKLYGISESGVNRSLCGPER